MTQTFFVNEQLCGNAADRILARKAELDRFFQEDWTRLRTLILSLEEELWDGTGPSHAVADRAADQALLETSSEFRLPSAENVCEPSPSGETGSPMERVAADRLSELASQIERRIKLANAGKR